MKTGSRTYTALLTPYPLTTASTPSLPRLPQREIMRGMKQAWGIALLFLVLIVVLPKPAVSQNSSGFEASGIKKLAFLTGPGNWSAIHEDIWVLDSLKSKPRRLAEGVAAIWSPDGHRIAYCAHEGWGTKHIVLGQMQLINANGSGLTQLTNEVGGACPISWSPDGKKISSRAGILVLDNDGTRVANVVRGAGGLWSPDGRNLAFSKYRESSQSSGSIWVASGDGTNPRKVIDENSEVVWLCWSSDGESLLFSSPRENKDRSEIFRVNLDGTHLERIAADKKLSFTHPVGSPDARYLVVDAYGGGSGETSIMLLDMTNRTRTVLAHGHEPAIVWVRQ